MDFECYECFQKFIDLNIAIKHLKDIHSIKDNTSKIKCLVQLDGHDACQRDYFSFKSMKSHAALCVKKRPMVSDKSVMIY